MRSSYLNGLFGTCGVRGVVGETINRELVERLARALAYHLGPGRRVCVGRDTRRSGPELEEQFVEHLAASGIHVGRLGVVSTPALYFLTRELGYDAGVMITASHNPAEYNGFKFCDSQGMCADQEAIAKAYFEGLALFRQRPGIVESFNGMQEYLARLRPLCPSPCKPLKLVVDCACGPNSRYVPDLLRSQGHTVLERNCEPDLEKCDRVPEPMESTLSKTIEFLQESGADAGLCFDGDNDRLVFLDREGFLGFQRGNAAMCLVALEGAATKQVVGSVETGRFVEQAVAAAGGTLRRTVVGDVNIARAAKESGAALGVEECGHYILPRIGYFSQTIYPATLLLAKRDINQVRRELAKLRPVYAAEERIPCAEESKPRIMMRVREQMLRLGGEATTIDGVRVDWEDGWLLVRPSGTSPYMKVNAEAFTPEQLDRLVSLGTGIVREALG